MKILKELRYTKEHEWVKLEGDVATIGITDYAQEQLSDIVFLELPDAGTQVEQLKAVWACSEFVAQSCIREPSLLADLVTSGDLGRAYVPGTYQERVSGALARHAEQTLAAIGEARTPTVRELLRNLVTAQGTRTVLGVDEVLSVFP